MVVSVSKRGQIPELQLAIERNIRSDEHGLA